MVPDSGREGLDLLAEEVRKVGTILHLDGQQTMKVGVKASCSNLFPNEKVRRKLGTPDLYKPLNLTLSADTRNPVAGTAEDRFHQCLGQAAFEVIYVHSGIVAGYSSIARMFWARELL